MVLILVVLERFDTGVSVLCFIKEKIICSIRVLEYERKANHFKSRNDGVARYGRENNSKMKRGV